MCLMEVLMIQIDGFGGLRKYGIDYLTGESCAYGYRGLCDLEPRGIALIAECFGINMDLFEASLPDAWNSRGVKSIMLAPQLIVPLAMFACFREGCTKVYIMHNSDKVVGIGLDDKPEDVERWESWNQGTYCEACRRYGAGGGIAFQYSNPGRSRNQHQMSGRIE
jgi:hypothetical protein